ncbi:retropepsin-like aspartic protease family protein [Algibacillus agarilyticus]|uniref:retropepsin-like aspartic protease family protein n=1 Tax=Algibacillus agarilyticus TaxID=2234133 RepID=UPI000DD02741|nr:TIGR02281 family clan AA aspartic protease [Algibacillus agarilyticus]
MEEQSPQPKDKTKAMGQWMHYAAWIAGLLLLTLFFDDTIEQKHNPNRAPQSNKDAYGNIEVVLQRNRQGHYIMNGYINDTLVTFLLDTGATNVSIPEHVAQKIGLEYGRERRVNTANGSVTVYQTNLNTLQLGDIVLHNVRGNINPHMDNDAILLGMSALKHLEFTQRGDTLTLKYY